MRRGAVVLVWAVAVILAAYVGGYVLVRALNHRTLPKKPMFEDDGPLHATVIDGKSLPMRVIHLLFYPLGKCEAAVGGRPYLRYDSRE